MIEDELADDTAAGSGENAEAAALAIALGQGGKLDPRAAAYMEEQTRLARLQIARMRAQDDHIDEEQRLQLSHLRVRRVSDYSKMLLEIGIGLFLLAVLSGFGIMVWNALHDHDLVIEAFGVPPDLAARGLTGQVIAAELLDRFTAMESQTQPTAQSEGTYRLNASDLVRIEIPETGGISPGEVDHYLRQTLGNEVHVAGEVAHTSRGIAIIMRAGAKPSARVDGVEADIGGMIQKTAEQLFLQSEPVRYADYLADTKRYDEAIAILRPLSLLGSPLERARVLTSWAEALDFDGKGHDALPVVEEAVRLAPDASFAWAVVSDAEIELGHDEAAHSAETQMVRTVSKTWSSAELASPHINYLPFYITQRMAAHSGDFAAADEAWSRFFAVGGSGITHGDAIVTLLERAPERALAHDIAGAHALVSIVGPLANDPGFGAAYANAAIDFEIADWRGVAKNAKLLDTLNSDPYNSAWQHVQVRPLHAIAMAQLGDFAGADALLARTPADCDLCARARGTIASLQHDWHTAEHWFALVAARSPSIPFADTDWGAMLLRKGDLGGAIAKFESAHAKGPHFADPLELWGEALMEKNRSDLALAKFEESDKYAPKWGRLHLKWGEALRYAGRKPAAMAQFATAARLDLSESDRHAANLDMKRPP